MSNNGNIFDEFAGYTPPSAATQAFGGFQNPAGDPPPQGSVHFDAPSESGSRGEVVPYQNLLHCLRQDFKSPEAVNCFGGRLFRSTNAHNSPIIAHAIENLNEQKTKVLTNEWYYPLSNMGPLFLTYDHSYELGNSVVITFRIPQDYRSLRQLMTDPNAGQYGGTLFKKLIGFLHDYHGRSKGNYHPLSALSLDTVFLDDRKEVHVLPLRSFSDNFPVCYPGEAGKASADITTDMYTAALVALQFMSGCEYECNGKTMKKCDDIPCLMECLSMFQSWRPPLQEVYHKLEQGSAQSGGATTSYDENGSPIKPKGGRGVIDKVPFLGSLFWQDNKSTYDNVAGGQPGQKDDDAGDDQSWNTNFFR